MPRTVPPWLPAGALRDREPPTLRGDEVVLRPWAVEDASLVLRAFTDPAIVHWHMRTVVDEDEARAFAAGWGDRWQQESDAGFVVTGGDGVAVGQVALREVDLATGWAELSYWVLPEARGRGIAVAAVRQLATWAFDDLGMHRLEVLHAVGNPASCRVADRAGFRLEGTLTRVLRHVDGWHDAHLHAAVDELPDTPG